METQIRQNLNNKLADYWSPVPILADFDCASPSKGVIIILKLYLQQIITLEP